MFNVVYIDDCQLGRHRHRETEDNEVAALVAVACVFGNRKTTANGGGTGFGCIGARGDDPNFFLISFFGRRF